MRIEAEGDEITLLWNIASRGALPYFFAVWFTPVNLLMPVFRSDAFDELL
jgi:hypothetical protein